MSMLWFCLAGVDPRFGKGGGGRAENCPLRWTLLRGPGDVCPHSSEWHDFSSQLGGLTKALITETGTIKFT